MNKKVFTNRTLNLRKIKYIGLDMDHTLVRYKTMDFEHLAYEGMKKKLVEDKNYPQEVLQLEFDFHSVIRGLVLDSSKGNLLKVSRHGAIRISQHGTQKISFHQQQRDYRGTQVDLGDANFSVIDTAFSISIAVLFAQLVKDRDENPGDYPDYSLLLRDIVDVMDMCHRDGSLKDFVRAHMKDYIIQEPEIARGLERYRKHGKKLFILTNSDFHYTKALLDYALNPFLEDHKDWTELFDYTITFASKPRFFFDKLNFLKVNPQDGSMSNYDADLTPGIYQGGCADLFEKSLKISGEDVLYIGDHIYGDILRLKKDCAWRTALVVEELGEEIEKMQKVKSSQEKIQNLMGKKLPLEEKVVDLVSDEIEKGRNHTDEIAQTQTAIAQLDQLIAPLIEDTQALFHPIWGEVMRAGNEESYFANQVDRFADIYMPTLGDLLALSPRTYFRSHRRPLAHEGNSLHG